jgi:putative endonuclease
MQQSWFCYMLCCKDGSLYVGMGNNVSGHLRRHNKGLGPEFTKKRRPVELLWSRKFRDRSAAKRTLEELKGWSYRKKLEFACRTAQAQGKGE